MKKPTTLEGFMMIHGKPGDIFYSEKLDRHLTAISTYYKRKIKTERLILIDGHKENPTAKMITRVILF